MDFNTPATNHWLRPSASVAVWLILAARIGAASVAAPQPRCEITARILEIEKSRHAPRLHPTAFVDYYRVRLDVREISAGPKAQERSGCDDSYLDRMRQRDYQVLTLMEYAKQPVKQGQEIKAEVLFGGDESLGGFFLSKIRTLDSAGGRGGAARRAGMCRGHLPANPDYGVAGIYLCVNDAGKRAFEVEYAAEDTGSDYYAPDGRHIARCGAFSDEPPSTICRELSRYSCDREKDMEPALCGHGKAVVLACGCGCCGGAEPLRKCLYRSRGDDPRKLIKENLAASKSPRCAVAGCSRGIEYVWCD